MRNKLSILAGATLVYGLGASSIQGETIGQSVLSALTESPSVMKSIARAEGAFEDITMAKARMRPNVLIEASAGAAYRDRSIDGVSTGSGDALFSKRATLTIQQTLYDWGATGRLVNSARLRQMYEELLIAEAREEQALLVCKTYMELIGARLKANVLANKVGYLHGYRELAEARKKAEGDVQGPVIDGKLANARADHEKVISQVNSLEARFQLLTMRDPRDLRMPPMPRIGSGSVDAEGAPGVVAAQYAVRSSRENVEALKKDLLPTISLELRAGAGEDVLGIEGPDNELSALAVIRWNPFDGGRKRAAIRKAQAQVREEEAIVEDIRLAINDRVASANAQLKGAMRRYDELTRSIGGLSAAVVQYDRLMKSGESSVTPLSMVSVQTERTSAQLEIVDAQVDRYVQAFTVLASAGQLLDFFGIKELSAQERRVTSSTTLTSSGK